MKNKSLLQLFSLTLVVAALSACGGGSQDPAAQLAELKGQKTEIEQKIADLEKQVNAGKPVTMSARANCLLFLTTR